MSRTATLSEYITDAETDADEADTESDESRPQWADSRLACQCGADITQWHSKAAARRLINEVGVDGRVPACPDCVEGRAGQDGTLATVPKALTKVSHSASAERYDPRALRLREVADDE